MFNPLPFTVEAVVASIFEARDQERATLEAARARMEELALPFFDDEPDDGLPEFLPAGTVEVQP